MNGIVFNGVMEGASTRQDGSLSIRISTGELIAEDCLAVFSLRNIPCEITLKPNDADALPPKEIRGELSKRTISERIRASLFVFWKQAGEPGTFEMFYASEGEKIVSGIKSKLKPV